MNKPLGVISGTKGRKERERKKEKKKKSLEISF
jgi:hypothetical protein